MKSLWPTARREAEPSPPTVVPAGMDAGNVQQGKSLEDLLIEATKLGRVWICTSRHTAGWPCSIDAHVNAVGTTVEFKSEFGCATPIEAAEQCLARARAAIAKMSEVPRG